MKEGNCGIFHIKTLFHTEYDFKLHIMKAIRIEELTRGDKFNEHITCEKTIKS